MDWIWIKMTIHQFPLNNKSFKIFNSESNTRSTVVFPMRETGNISASEVKGTSLSREDISKNL